MAIKAVIFDFDGVLVESFDIKTKAFAQLYRFAGETQAKEGVRYHVVNGGVSRFKKIRHFYAEILKEPLAEQRFNKLCVEYAQLVKNLVIDAPFVSGAKEFLDAYSGQLKCYVVSGAPQEEVRQIVEARDMKKYFYGVFGSPEEKSPLTKKIISANNFDAKQVVFVGDALSDWSAAQENGLHFVLRSHCDNQDIFKDKNCITVSDLTDLGDMIQSF